ncbi:MAG: thioesterase family protein [Planctomycetales bacterium]
MRLDESPLMPEYRHVMRWPVQWGDQDAYQHVNNTIFFRWFETGRMTYTMDIGLDRERLEADGLGIILAAIDCKFKFPIIHPDTVHIGSRVTRFGRTSMTLQHAIYSEKQSRLVAEGDSAVVVYNYKQQQSIPIPDFVREAIERLEGKTIPGK